MYYEQLQALGAHYGLQKQAGLEKKALSPTKVIAALKKVESLSGPWTYLNRGGLAPRINPFNGRLKGGLTGGDIATAVKDGIFANKAIFDKQLPYLSKLLDARVDLERLAGGIGGNRPIHPDSMKTVTDVLQSNSPSMRKALLHKLNRSAVV